MNGDTYMPLRVLEEKRDGSFERMLERDRIVILNLRLRIAALEEEIVKFRQEEEG